MKKIKIFKPALGFDFENKVAHVGVPLVETYKDSKGKTLPRNKIYIITSKKEWFELSEEEKEKRGLYPDKLPQFPLGINRWLGEYLNKFLKGNNDDIFNPYLEVFLPIKETLEKHIDFSHPSHSSLIAIWIMGTYLFPVFEAYPYLLLNGTRGSGKSKLLEILYYLAFNAELTSNATPSSVFRIIEANLSTILIDEGERLTGNEREKDLQLLLNAGYKKSGIVTRTNKDTHQVEQFSVYSPKAIASINPLDQTLASRVIPVTMIKTGNRNKGNVRVNDRSADWEGIRNGLYRFVLNCGFDVAEVFNNSSIVNLLESRNNELWSPILAIAEYLDHFHPDADLFMPLARMAKEEANNTEALDDWHSALLDSLKNIVTVHRSYLIKDIKKGMVSFIEDAFELEKISGRWIGNALVRFGFRKASRQSDGVVYSIDPEKVKDLRIRYGLDEPSVHNVDNTRVEDTTTNSQSVDQLTPSPTTPNSESEAKIEEPHY